MAFLVDNEEFVRMNTADMRIDLGLHVAEAHSADEALNPIKDEMNPDLLSTDYLMPGMTSAELAREARLINPAVSILFVSGRAEMNGIAPTRFA
ncbi:hypothetical protein C7I55_07960 [Sphingomonas deserti]|uniref:Response regulatory domain-containing protein n=2 Tax=Allosphingosinicella deserti TaxID=2116704 RepID=A0A2P7QW31_9SPHN|nr:hypothetical protein C7I55_07960 [Sphingomonas deserti]